ncbi:SCO4402 family protein [Angustibacter aerolatus]
MTVEYPEMRLEVISALRSLADPAHQRSRWGVWEEGVSYYDDLDLCVHVLYDDCEVLPDPRRALGAVLRPADVPSLQALYVVLDPLLTRLGDRPDADYMAEPAWPAVVQAAQLALRELEESDAQAGAGSLGREDGTQGS